MSIMKTESYLKRVMLMVLTAIVCGTMMSCGDDDDELPGDMEPGEHAMSQSVINEVAGTWVSTGYYYQEMWRTVYGIFSGNKFPCTVITLRPDGTCYSYGINSEYHEIESGLLPSGESTYKMVYNDSYERYIYFYKGGKKVMKVELSSYKNGHKTGMIRIPGYDDIVFIYDKQEVGEQ